MVCFNQFHRLFIVLFLFVSACVPTEEKPTKGVYTDGIYRNNFFQLSLVVPDGWRASTDEEIEKLMTVGSETIKQLNDSLSSVLDSNDFSEPILFIMLKTPESEGGKYKSSGFPSSLILTYDKQKELNDSLNSEDYLNQLIEEYAEFNQLKMHFDQEFRQELIGDKEFVVLEGRANFGLMQLRQEYWHTLYKGYSLVLIATYTNSVDKIELHSSIKNMSQ